MVRGVYCWWCRIFRLVTNALRDRKGRKNIMFSNVDVPLFKVPGSFYWQWCPQQANRERLEERRCIATTGSLGINKDALFFHLKPKLVGKLVILLYRTWYEWPITVTLFFQQLFVDV